MRKIIVLLILSLVVVTGFKPKKRMQPKQLITTNGKKYNIRTAVVTGVFTLSINQFRPYVILRATDDQQIDNFFNAGHPIYNEVKFSFTTPKPIIPLHCSMFMYFPATFGLVFAMSTPFLVELGDIPVIPPFPLSGSTRYVGYAEKIAPFAQRVYYALDPAYTAGKSYIGDINLLNYEQIPFHSDDFLAVRPSYLFPTDGQKWYLNFQEVQTIPANTYDSGPILTYQYTAGVSLVGRCTLIYAELE